MRHYRLTLILSLAALGAFAFAAGWLLATARIPQAILSLAGMAVAAATAYVTTRRPIRAIALLSSALESDSATILIPPSDDPDIRHTAGILNRIARDRASAAISLETRKLYYDRILRIITHEMRNSIAPVIALSDDILARPGQYTGEPLAEAAGIINDQSRSIKRFLDSYYELTHLPQPVVGEIDGAELMTRLWHNVAQHSLRAGITTDHITVNVASGFTLAADRDLILRALTNLMRNAIDASSSVADPQITVTAMLTPEGGASVTITDNGPGLPPSVADNLFQPFLTTKPGGSGIGLCLSRQIARLHGGDLRLTPSHTGASFTLTLPPPDMLQPL